MPSAIQTASLKRQIKMCQKSLAAASRHGRAGTAKSLKIKLERLLHNAQLEAAVHQRGACSTEAESTMTGSRQVAPAVDDGDGEDDLSFFEVADEPMHAHNYTTDGSPLHAIQKTNTTDRQNNGVGTLAIVVDKRSRRTRRRERRLHLLDQAASTHPSWEAARIARSKITTARFCGKRKTFIDSSPDR
mmetsp:Transcript_18482/g.36243  ORF Transcript_18482/g.36243 Transcript_18482/m.36243 type:complete len:188 (-) Transcript_18482:214-777(-)